MSATNDLVAALAGLWGWPDLTLPSERRYSLTL
jgi:hypothetical protein